jgi:hypothetical protein
VAILVVEADADLALENVAVMKRAARVDREPVREWGEGSGIVHRRELSINCAHRGVFFITST